MADLSDVETALIGRLVELLYPDGLDQPSAVGATCRIYRGWPSPASLNADLSAGIANITVFPASTPDEILPRYFDQTDIAPVKPRLSAAVANNSVTFSGTADAGQTVGLLVDNLPITYRTAYADTPDLVAANLAATVSAVRAATNSGATVTIPGARTLVVRISTPAKVIRQLRRQRKELQISCWCPSPALRDKLCATIDPGMTASQFISLPDGSQSHIVFAGNQVFDQSQNASLYRRDLCYFCEYSIVGIEIAPVMIFGELVSGAARSTI